MVVKVASFCMRIEQKALISPRNPFSIQMISKWSEVTIYKAGCLGQLVLCATATQSRGRVCLQQTDTHPASREPCSRPEDRR